MAGPGSCNLVLLVRPFLGVLPYKGWHLPETLCVVPEGVQSTLPHLFPLFFLRGWALCSSGWPLMHSIVKMVHELLTLQLMNAGITGVAHCAQFFFFSFFFKI